MSRKRKILFLSYPPKFPSIGIFIASYIFGMILAFNQTGIQIACNPFTLQTQCQEWRIKLFTFHSLRFTQNWHRTCFISQYEIQFHNMKFHNMKISKHSLMLHRTTNLYLTNFHISKHSQQVRNIFQRKTEHKKNLNNFPHFRTFIQTDIPLYTFTIFTLFTDITHFTSFTSLQTFAPPFTPPDPHVSKLYSTLHNIPILPYSAHMYIGVFLLCLKFCVPP